MRYQGAALLLTFCVHVSTGLWIIPGASSNCSQQGLPCKVTINNCMDRRRRLAEMTEYIPAAPERLEVRWETREDQEGNIFPVINATWNMVDDGSISYMKATELHVLMRDTNQNLCVRYSFFQRLPSRNPSGEKWSFSASTVMVDPGQTYLVSVFNIPKPELLHSGYNVHKEITVPDCKHPRLKKSKFCIDTGSLWSPNITGVRDSDTLYVGFNTDRRAEWYRVHVRCLGRLQVTRADGNNMTSLNVTLNMDVWPTSCCDMDIEIEPFFPKCNNDCTRHRKSLPFCKVPETAPADSSSVIVATCSLVGLVLCALIACIMYAILKPRKRPKSDISPQLIHQEGIRLDARPPKLLVIYSQDHPLYRTVVLNLCAFLKAKCGTEVLVDLLDTTMVGVVGTTRWLEWQRQQLRHPVDKILILCSRGVQAKWRAMCGQERVMLREDVLSPNDDMLVPFLNLFLPSMHRPAALGKYIVAYFEDLTEERDVPSVFDIAVKYRLMKHFEELYFRILEMEKYEPGRVNHIEGIGKEEYFGCPSGKALRDAIEAFKAYQVENPDWFEAECVASEEDAVAQRNLRNKPPEMGPVLECVPLIRDGPPVLVNEAKLFENATSVYELTPELNRECHAPSVVALEPRVNPASQELYRENVPLVNQPSGCVTQQLPCCSDAGKRVLLAGVLPAGHGPVEDDEQTSCPRIDRGPVAPQHSSCLDIADTKELLGGLHPVEVGAEELLLWVTSQGPSTSSDQGYISKELHQPGRPEPETDPLMALARLQEELFQTSLP